jgi:hypothetical protein
MATPTTDQLRDQIDRGQTGEKVNIPDPAAAPLGTDAEAGGNTPTRAERKVASATAPQSPEHKARPGAWIYLALVGVLGVAIMIVLAVALPS